MIEQHPVVEPARRTDAARLQLARMRLEDGIKLEEVFTQLTETSANTLNVARAGIWLFAEQRRKLLCVDLYDRSKNHHYSGATLHPKDFPEYFASLEQRKTLPAEDAQNDPRTHKLAEAYLIPLGITSMLDAPILVGGEVVGVICHEHIGPAREWTTEERDFAGSLADILAVKIRAAEMQELQKMLRVQEAQLAETRRQDSLSQMAAGVAHDFNNVLTVMIGNAEMMALTPNLPPEIVTYAKQIVDAGARGINLAKELMSYAKPGPQSSRVIWPSEILTAQLSILKSVAGEKFTVSLDVKSSKGRVLMAPDQLERVVLNLVVNARDAMPNGGHITIVVDTVEDKYPDGKHGRFVLVEVQDTGTGIPAELLERIFDPFFTTKPRGQGTGLGLAVISQVVDYVGGFVRVNSKLGEGTTFQIFLPRVSSQG